MSLVGHTDSKCVNLIVGHEFWLVGWLFGRSVGWFASIYFAFFVCLLLFFFVCLFVCFFFVVVFFWGGCGFYSLFLSFLPNYLYRCPSSCLYPGGFRGTSCRQERRPFRPGRDHFVRDRLCPGIPVDVNPCHGDARLDTEHYGLAAYCLTQGEVFQPV